MNDTSVEPTLDTGQTTWNVAAERMHALRRAWEANSTPPPLRDYVPAGSTALRRLVLAELIKLDLGYRWARQAPRQLEDYAAEFPELAGPAGVPCDLIVEEFRVRRSAGEAVNVSQYFARFPKQAAELSRLLDGATAPTMATPDLVGQPHEVSAGECLDDFDLLSMIGEGAFARVFLARQRSMQRLVALKVSADRGDEPQTLAQLDHPHIVRVYDQRVLRGRGLRLLYMPYLPGGTLQDVLTLLRQTPAAERTGRLLLKAVDEALARRGEVPPVDAPLRQRLAGMTWPEVVCWLGARLAEALGAAHRQSVLHRDIKPANVLLGADAAPRLADFNVSVCSKLEGASPAAFFGGSVGYMSPEQLEAFNPAHERAPDSLDGRADVYALALTLWELLTGSRPFPDEAMTGDWSTLIAAMCQRRYDRVAPSVVTQLPADLPPGLSDVLLTCLEPDRERRYATAGELARQLDLCLKPRTRRLLFPEAGWQTWVRRHPLLAFYPVGLVPNLLASWFSIIYNETEIVADFPAAEPMFRTLQVVVNGCFFPLGVLLFGWLIWPVARGLGRLRGEKMPAAELAELRRACLRLGPGSVVVCLTLWVLAGVIFPVTMHLAVHQLPASFHWHFLASQTLCGLIAVSYPYFGVMFLALRAVFPGFIHGATLTSADTALLRRTERSLNLYLVLAASVPMLAVGLLALIQSKNHLVLGILSFVAVLGFALAYTLTAAIRSDSAALRELEK